MKWNRKGILLCAMMFLALAGIVAVRTYLPQSHETDGGPAFATEEDLAPPLSADGAVPAVTGGAASYGPEDRAQKEPDATRKEKPEKKRAGATAAPSAATAGTAPPDDGKKGKEEKAATNAGKIKKGRKTKAKKNVQEPTPPVSQLPASAPAVRTPEAAAVSFEIQCTAVMDQKDLWKDGIEEVIPASGYFYRGKQEISEGDTVYDVLKRICEENDIALDTEYTPLFGSYYIKGIGNLYEFDCGSESGWKYMVNGSVAGVGCSSYRLTNGDRVVFFYDCQL